MDRINNGRTFFFLSKAAFLGALALTAACKQQAPMVYVLESPQSITLTGAADPGSASRGDTVVLRVERRTQGQWKSIPRHELKPGQCWVYRPPAQSEKEVAGNLQWDVVPESAVQFDRQYRMDGARAATVLASGKITITPISPVTCEADRVVEGPPILIEVS